MPPDTQLTFNTKTKRKPAKCGTGSLPTPKPSDFANSIGTPTARTVLATDALEEKAKQESKSTQPTTTQAPIKATQTGFTSKWQSKPQKHSKPHGGHCPSLKSPEDVILLVLDLGTDYVSLIGSEVESAT